MPFKEIVGQERLKTILYNSIKNNEFSHAYLFLGPENTGKRYAAMIFAKSLLCQDFKEDPCERCVPCKKVQNLSHPDLLLIEPEKNSIKIETIKNIKKDISFKPFEGKKKIVIIDKVDKTTKEASNALLKTLEEPPKDTIFILISPNYYSLLPTIVSRCQKITFHQLSSSIIREFLIKTHSMDYQKAEWISLLSRGRIGKAILIKDNSNFKSRDKAWEIISRLSLNQMDVIFNNVKELTTEKEDLDEIFEWLFLFCRDIAVIKNRADTTYIINNDLIGDLENLSQRLSISAIHDIYAEIKNTDLLLRKNVNHRLALENMIMNIFSIRSQITENGHGYNCRY
ncbi:MAG TPA: DNA polymerase III subunit delta' [Nitrospinota bacterium]|nr:DNA polymerase III subunit delta' [Nitrospinota bacterium]